MRATPGIWPPALAQMRAMPELGSAPGAVLVSTRCYRQRGTRYAPEVPA